MLQVGLDADGPDVVVLSANERLDFYGELYSGGRGRNFYRRGFQS